jgi:hypothetical protein
MQCIFIRVLESPRQHHAQRQSLPVTVLIVGLTDTGGDVAAGAAPEASAHIELTPGLDPARHFALPDVKLALDDIDWQAYAPPVVRHADPVAYANLGAHHQQQAVEAQRRAAQSATVLAQLQSSAKQVQAALTGAINCSQSVDTKLHCDPDPGPSLRPAMAQLLALSEEARRLGLISNPAQFGEAPTEIRLSLAR